MLLTIATDSGRFDKQKDKRKQNEILLINASQLFKKGKPKNCLPDESMRQIAAIYLDWKEEDAISEIITQEGAAKNDYNLSSSRYVAQGEEDDTVPLEDAVVLLREAEEEREAADEKLQHVSRNLGLR